MLKWTEIYTVPEMKSVKNKIINFNFIACSWVLNDIRVTFPLISNINSWRNPIGHAQPHKALPIKAPKINIIAIEINGKNPLLAATWITS